MDSYSAYVGTRIKHFRKAQNLTIEDLARIINKSKSAVSKYENGQISIDIETLKDIADALKINVSQIIYYTPPGKIWNLLIRANYSTERKNCIYTTATETVS